MKLNTLYLLIATTCLVTAMPLFSAIVRITEWQKTGFPTITLCGDRHDLAHNRQEKVLRDALAKKAHKATIHVYVEDMLEDQIVANSSTILPSLLNEKTRPSILGLVSRLKAEGIATSSIEFRRDLINNCTGSYQNFIDGYRQLAKDFTVINATDLVDVLSNEIIEVVEKRDEPILKKLELLLLNSLTFQEKISCGLELMDVLVLKKLCKQDDIKNKYLISGCCHSDSLGLILNYLGYTQTRCLQEGDSKVISQVYQSFVTDKDSYCDIWAIQSTVELLPPVSPEQIEEYFQNPNAYRLQEQSCFDWLKNKVCAIIGLA